MTTHTTRPFVLHIDDEPDDLKPWKDEVQSQGRIDIDICHPRDVTEANLKKASLVLAWISTDGD
jgi:hypothetical protein